MFRNQSKSLFAKKGNNLIGKIDEFRVKDARKAFRRRYASRTNLDKIFSQYDADKKGYVTAHDLHKQGTNIGLGLSLDEAQCLIQSAMADKNKKDVIISRDEFADLIFSQDENLNLMLSNLAPM